MIFKKVYRILFPKKYTSTEIFQNKLKNNILIDAFQAVHSIYEIKLKSNLTLKIRNHNSSDYDVFEQIFNREEYKPILKLLTLNNIDTKEIIIIDAGANIGLTSVYFSHYLRNVKIFAIEPSSENADLYHQNISFLENRKNITLYNKALSSKADLSYSILRNFRDGKDWSIATKIDENGKIKGITLESIITENKLSYITLLKIDIEGAERFIFNFENNLDFLKVTKIIAIEIHDEFPIRETIYTILIKENFYLFETGELTIGLNKSF